MGLRKLRPITPGTRHALLNDFAEVTLSSPVASLTQEKRKTGGRNNTGRVTAWHRGGGHRQRHRIVDFRRDKDAVGAKVVGIEYDPNRSAFLALLQYADGEKRYILAPVGLAVGREVRSGNAGIDFLPGNAMPLGQIPPGTFVHNIEFSPGRGGQLVRSAGTTATLSAKEPPFAHVTLPSGEIRKFLLTCRATIGQVGNVDHNGILFGKAGRRRWMGWRPKVRGSCQNPVSHPMGGGEGRRSGGRHPVSPWGKIAKGGKTRPRKKPSNRFLVRRAKGKKVG
ncbi:MAG: 50S ribosomal protein L2 [Planctomycetes bacterium]|nr:50S ribosomal protein L2 [Planctomycetota bacterium]